jgi:hypothetical protein
MGKLLEEIKYDASFIRGHALQPQWYKVFKVFMIFGFLAGYWYLFGGVKLAVFAAVFFSLSLLMHMVYRVKTERWSKSWLDFVVLEEDGEAKPQSIGKFYYAWVILNAVVGLVVSQVFV